MNRKNSSRRPISPSNHPSRHGPYGRPLEHPSRGLGHQKSYPPTEPVMEIERSQRRFDTRERFSDRERGKYEEHGDHRPVVQKPKSSTRELNKLTVDGRPIFRGPDELMEYDIKDLKTIAIDLHHSLPNRRDDEIALANPADILRFGDGSRPVINREEIIQRNEKFWYRSKSTLKHDSVTSDPHTVFDISRHNQHSVCERSEFNMIALDIHRNPPSTRTRIRERTILNREDAVHVRQSGEGANVSFAQEKMMKVDGRSMHEPGPSYDNRNAPVNEGQRVAIDDKPPRSQSSGGLRYKSPIRYLSSSGPPTFFKDENEHKVSSRDFGRSRDFDGNGPGPNFGPNNKNCNENFERGAEGSDLRRRIHEKRDRRDYDMQQPMEDNRIMERERDSNRRPMMQDEDSIRGAKIPRTSNPSRPEIETAPLLRRNPEGRWHDESQNINRTSPPRGRGQREIRSPRREADRPMEISNAQVHETGRRQPKDFHGKESVLERERRPIMRSFPGDRRRGLYPKS